MRYGIALLAALAFAALAAPLAASWLGHDPFLPDLFNRFEAPSATHPLGTDELGRDLFLRLLEGARVSLAVGMMAALASTVIGTLVGLVAAWRGGVADALLMRLADGLLALPS
ncbi:MAG: synthetase, partial [Rubritepida sp.]|nr:synthetase [Rubritepida sp.]